MKFHQNQLLNGMDISGDAAPGNYPNRLKRVINLYPNGTYCYTTW
jgi:hypothetical protein